MGRRLKWAEGSFNKYKLKLPKKSAEIYQEILNKKKKTIQKDFEDYVDSVIK